MSEVTVDGVVYQSVPETAGCKGCVTTYGTKLCMSFPGSCVGTIWIKKATTFEVGKFYTNKKGDLRYVEQITTGNYPVVTHGGRRYSLKGEVVIGETSDDDLVPGEYRTPFKVGETYRDKYGNKVTIEAISCDSLLYPLRTDRGNYALNGRYLSHIPTNSDLVIPEEKETPMFEVGKTYKNTYGTLVTIVSIDDDDNYPLQDSSGRRYTLKGAYYQNIPSGADLIPGAVDTPAAFDPHKPFMTRGGHKAKLLAIVPECEKETIAALIDHPDGPYIQTFRSDGRCYEDPSEQDLINVERHEVTLNGITYVITTGPTPTISKA